MKKAFLWTLPFLIVIALGYYFTFVKNTGYFWNSLVTGLATEKLNNILKEIELHKVKYKKYPETLEKIRKTLENEAGPFSFPLIDPSLMECKKGNQEYYYEKIDDDHYYLLGLGCDLTPFTNDDLLPTIEIKNFGLKTHENI